MVDIIRDIKLSEILGIPPSVEAQKIIYIFNEIWKDMTLLS